MADDSEQVGQDEIERLLSQSQPTGSGASDPPAAEPAAKEPAADVALDNSEIEALLQQSQAATPAPAAAQAAIATAPPQTASASSEKAGQATGGSVEQSDVEALLQQAEQAIASLDEPIASLPPGAKPFEFKDLAGSTTTSDPATLELMRDVQLDLRIELGRTHMHLEDVLQLKSGAVVTLDKLAGDPVDIFVNGRLIARGEVLVLNDNFCVRVAELIVGESACA